MQQKSAPQILRIAILLMPKDINTKWQPLQTDNWNLNRLPKKYQY